MPLPFTSSVTCTHNYGKPLPKTEWPVPMFGRVELQAVTSMELKRTVPMLRLLVPNGSSGLVRDALPALHDPELVTFSSDRAATFRGWEMLEGRRYYQSWLVRLEAPVELDELYLLRREYKRLAGKPWDFKAAWDAERGKVARPREEILRPPDPDAVVIGRAHNKWGQ